jgi:hypothetical protein
VALTNLSQVQDQELRPSDAASAGRMTKINAINLTLVFIGNVAINSWVASHNSIAQKWICGRTRILNASLAGLVIQLKYPL